MTGRQRVLGAIKRQKTDTPPTALKCTPEVWDKFKAHFGVSTEEEVMDCLDIDFRWVDVPYIGPEERSGKPVNGVMTNVLGIKRISVTNEFNTYDEIIEHPLAYCKTVADVEAYEWPSPDWWDYSAIKDIIARHKQKDDRSIMFFIEGSFEVAWGMRGLEQYLIDLYENPELAVAISRKSVELYTERARRAFACADGQIDILGTGSDLGTQQSMMMSPAIWREWLKPINAAPIAEFRDRVQGVFYHTCGHVLPIIDDLIGMGVDILNPIQPLARGMDAENLQRLYGGRITFHGGIDEVELLPHATPDEVYAETRRVIDVLGAKDHGYIVCPSHYVQNDTPIENVMAIFRAAREYK